MPSEHCRPDKGEKSDRARNRAEEEGFQRVSSTSTETEFLCSNVQLRILTISSVHYYLFFFTSQRCSVSIANQAQEAVSESAA